MRRSALAVALGAGILYATAGPADGAVIRPFAARFSVNATGDITLAGNSLLTCTPSASCTTAQNGGSTNNNQQFMRYIDVDGVDSTPTAASDNSSRAQLVVPPSGQVLFAGLYWGADTSAGGAVGGSGPGAAAPNAAARGQAVLTPPGGSATPLTATQVDAQGTRYQAFVNVTGLVRAAGSGVYTLADIQAGTGADRYGGWALVVAFEDPSLPIRNLTVFDGYAVIQQSPATDQTVDIPISGFETPATGPVTTRVGAVSYEGDKGSTGDQLLVDGAGGFVNLTNTPNPANNVFNSSITDLGQPVAGRDPSYSNNLGYDVDRFDASGVLANGATDTTLRLTTTSETYFPGVVTFATDLFAPEIVVAKAAVDVNGGNLEPGDEILYDLTARNVGGDGAIETVVSDLIPPGTTFVPGSLLVNGASTSDAVGDDVGEFDSTAPSVRFFIGTGASGTGGGALGIDETATMGFRVRVNSDVPDGTVIPNQATASYQGNQTGIILSGTSNETRTPAVAESDLSIDKQVLTASPLTTPGDVTWRLIVTNNGPDPERAAVITDTLPAGLVASAATPSQGSCTSGATVTCTLGVLAVGATAAITITVPIPSQGGTIENVATIAGANRDVNAGNDTATSVLPLNRPPVAVDDSVTTPADTPVTVPILTNDSDPDGHSLNVIDGSATPPANGSVITQTQPDGTQQLVYTPDPGFKGTDTLTYLIGDGQGGTTTALVTFEVLNSQPVALDDSAATPLDVPVSGSVLDNDTDPNNDPLTATLLTPPASGNLVLNTDGTYAYTPAPGFTGTVTATYQVDDGDGGTATATLTITVTNDPPIAIDDRYVLTPGQTTITANILDNDTDGNAPFDDITVIGIVDSGGNPVDPATLTFAADGTVTFNRPPSATGELTFTYTIEDEAGATDTATITFVLPNRPPVAVDDTVTVDPLAPTTIDVLVNDSDPDGDVFIISGTNDVPPRNGTVEIDTSGQLIYTPTPGFRGTDTFTYTISDGNGGSSTATVTVTVPNQPPVAAADARTNLAGQPVTVPVLLNDSDPNGDPLTVTAVSTPANGTVVVNPDGTVTYTPSPGFVGSEALTYTISDGAGGTTTATLTITVLNLPPVAVDDNTTTPPNTPVQLSPLGNDADGNGDGIRIISIGTAVHGTVVLNPNGTITYTPSPGFSGVEDITYAITDGRGGVSVATLHITVPLSTEPQPDVAAEEDVDETLPFTGSGLARWLILAGVLVAAGGASLLVHRSDAAAPDDRGEGAKRRRWIWTAR